MIKNSVAATTSGPMEPLVRREQLSALADGQLQGADLVQAMAYAQQDQDGRATWEIYHLVGDVLRSADLARPGRPEFMARLRTELAKEPLLPAGTGEELAQVASPASAAANENLFRWKMVAGFASLAAVAAIGWSALSHLQGIDPAGMGGAQLARSTPEAAATPAITVTDAQGQNVMIRDPRLDELLAAHKQFGSTSALQMPAGFLRNATFETPGR